MVSPEAVSPEDDEIEGKGPLRTCILTRVVQPKDGMIRFVVGPGQCLTPDLRGNLPGRGIWLTATADAVAEAVRRKVFARALKKQGGQVTIPPGLGADIEGLMERQALQALSLANKAGVVVAGSAKVEAAIAKGHVGAIVHAKDGGADGIRKIDQAWRRHRPDAVARKIKLFESAQLDLALGRPNVIHAALNASGACEGFLTRCHRLAFFRTGASADAPTGTPEDRAGTVMGPPAMQ